MSRLSGSPAIIPCLSLWQPWASLFPAGLKIDETRHWPTKVRGRVAIHAAKTVDVEGAPEELCRFAFGSDWPRALVRGAVEAVGDLVACWRTEDVAGEVSWCNYLAGNFGPGRFAFRFENVRPLGAPIPLVGRQGFFSWTPPEDLEERLEPPVDPVKAGEVWEAVATAMGLEPPERSAA